MTSQGYIRTTIGSCVYIRSFPGNKFIILLFYVDDMLIVGQDARLIKKLKKALHKSFDIKDLRPTKQILGIEIVRDIKSKRL